MLVVLKALPVCIKYSGKYSTNAIFATKEYILHKQSSNALSVLLYLTLTKCQ